MLELMDEANALLQTMTTFLSVMTNYHKRSRFPIRSVFYQIKLNDFFETLTHRIPPHLRLPPSSVPDELFRPVKAVIDRNQLAITLHVPLVSLRPFRLFRLISLSTVQPPLMRWLRLDVNLFATDGSGHHLERVAHTDECSTIGPDLLCETTSALDAVRARCLQDLWSHRKVSTSCAFQYTNIADHWIRITDFVWAFHVSQATTIAVDSTTSLSIHGQGLLTLGEAPLSHLIYNDSIVLSDPITMISPVYITPIPAKTMDAELTAISDHISNLEGKVMADWQDLKTMTRSPWNHLSLPTVGPYIYSTLLVVLVSAISCWIRARREINHTDYV